MLDISKIAQDAINGAIADGTFEKVISEAVVKTVSSQLECQFRSYSEFSKKLEKEIEAAINVDISCAGLDKFNMTIAQIVNKKVQQKFGEDMAASVGNCLDAIVTTIKDSYKLSELITVMKEESDRFDRDDSRNLTCIVEDDDNRLTPGYQYIYLDYKANKRKFGCGIRISLKDGKVWNLQIDGTDIKNKLFFGPMYGFERLLFQLFARQTTLEIDEDIDTEYDDDGED